MNDRIEVGTITSEYAVNRMFELVTSGQRDSAEYAQLDDVIRTRLLATYDDGDMDAAPDMRTAAAA